MAESTAVNFTASDVVKQTLDALAKSKSVNLSMDDAQDIKPAIIKEMADVITNQTNQEPWYQSRVTIGAIVAVVAGVAGVAGYSFDAEDQRVWIDSISQGVQLASAAAALVGGTYAWYGRWRAKKALGAGK